MKYQIGTFTLDTQARTLSDRDNCQSIRPKTLALLLYLAQRSGQIITKQELLDNIWDDVTVDDGVVFQSIREIRQLFSNSKIIQNYPRKGYEFTVQAYKLNPKNNISQAKLVLFKYMLPSALIILAVVLFFPLNINENVVIKYDHNIVVLPIKNHIPYTENDWIYLGGMEQFIAKLKGLPNEIFVHQGTYIPRLMHIAGLERNFQSADVNKIFNVSGATVVVETEIHGNVSDYKLVYKFHLVNSVKQGVILDTSINSALTVLSKKLADFINSPLKISNNIPMKEFSDALFSEAMISYESDWHTSISFFESYLALNQKSVIAMIYLSKLYLWNNEVEQATSLMNKASKLANRDTQEVAHINLIKGRIAAKKKDWQQAMEFYEQAAKSIKNNLDWLLKASIAEEQGLAYIEQNLLDGALQSFNLALSFYQIIQSPIGINSTQLHLADVLFQQGNIDEAIRTYLQAKQDIQRLNIEFLYSMLDYYERKFNKHSAKDTGYKF
tara:strand:+ start:5536 stop:7029 length:1494 start_codon:yes stop_codon:yes gene_type:complete